MANAKIINYGQPIGAGSTAIPDNVEVALDIETTAGEDWILIDTENGAENMTLAGGNYTVQIGTDQRGPRMRQGHGGSASPGYPVYTFRGDTDTGMTHLGTSNDNILAFVAGGTEGIRVVKDSSSSKIMVGINGAPDDQDNPVLQLTGDGSESELIIRRAANGESNDEVAYLGYRAQGAFSIDAEGGIQFRNHGGSKRAEIDSSGNFTTYHTTAVSGAALSTVGALATALTDSGGTASVSTSGSSTTLTGVNTTFTTDFHVGAAIKVGSVTTTVTAIASNTELTLQDAINTGSTGTTCTRDGGELFAVKTGDSKTLFSVQPTGAIGAGANANAHTGVYNNLGIGDPTMFDKITTGNALFVMGNQSGDYDFTTANALVAIGYAACAASTTSQNLVAIGTYAADTDTDIRESVIIGGGAGRSSGNDSVHIGHAAGAGSTGTANVSIGRDALATSGASASHVAIGRSSAGKVNAAATGCVSVGHTSNGEVTSGVKNTAVGYFANGVTTTGTLCTVIGAEANPSANNTTNEVVLGASAVGQGANTVMLGSSAITGLHCYDTSISSPSDSRIKDSVQDSGLGLDFINALRPVKYQKKHPSEFPEEIREARWADREVTRTKSTEDGGTEEYTETVLADTKPDDWQPRTEYGLIAQEVKAAMEAQGGADWQGHTVLPSGMESLGYGNLVTVLVKAVQELTSQNESLAARVAELEAGD